VTRGDLTELGYGGNMTEYTKWELDWLSKNVSYFFNEDSRRPKLMGAHIYKPPRRIYDQLGGMKAISK